jgi:hypothetical protein
MFQGGSPMTEEHAPVYRVCEHITSREVDGEVFLMDLRSLHTYALNRTAAFVWSLVDGRRSREDICRAATERFEIAPDACRGEIAELLAVLEAEQLISPSAHA